MSNPKRAPKFRNQFGSYSNFLSTTSQKHSIFKDTAAMAKKAAPSMTKATKKKQAANVKVQQKKTVPQKKVNGAHTHLIDDYAAMSSGKLLCLTYRPACVLPTNI